MPKSGLYAHWDEYIIRATMVDGAYSRTGPAPGVVNVVTTASRYATFPFEVLDGIRVTVESGYYGTLVPPGEKYFYRLSIPGLLIAPPPVTGDSFKSDMDSHVRVVNLRLRLLDTMQWLCTWDEIEWYIEGSLHATFAVGGSLASQPGFIAPAYIPLLGIPAGTSGVSYSEATPLQYSRGQKFKSSEYVVSAPTPYSWDLAASQTVNGGWQYKENAVSVTLPIDLTEVALPTGTGCTIGATPPSLFGTTTNNIEFETSVATGEALAYAGEFTCPFCPDGSVASVQPTYDAWSVIGYYNDSKAFIDEYPALDKRLVRLTANDYRAIWQRFGFPRAKAGAHRSCQTAVWSTCDPPEFDPADVHVEGYGHDSLAEMLSVVGPDQHKTMEEPFEWRTHAPHGREALSIEWKYFQVTLKNPGSCGLSEPEGDAPPIHETCCAPGEKYYRYNYATSGFGAIAERLSNLSMHPYLDHVDPYARYVNYNCNPHWSFLLYFPPDVDATHWFCQGEKRESAAYWIPSREQYLDHSSLPTLEKRKTRNSITSEPLLDGMLGSFVDSAFVGVPTHWPGITRFDAQTLTPTSSNTASPEMVSLENCTAAYGSRITLTPSDTAIAVTVSLGSFDDSPFMFGHIAGRFTIDGDLDNISSVHVYLVSQQGDRVLLTDTLSSTIISRPLDADDAYAGSWARDFGKDGVVDEGADVGTGGVSASTMADAELSHFFSLLSGRDALSLRYEIEVVDPGDDVTIDFPVLRAPATPITSLPENGATQLLLWSHGPGVRFGEWDWWDDDLEELRDTPQIREFGRASSVLDALIYKRLVFEGVDKEDGLDSEIATLYDEEEGQERIDVARNTHAFIRQIPQTSPPLFSRPAVLCLVNSLRELPPLMTFPKRARDGATLQYQPAGAYVQHSYSHITEPRRIVRAQNEAHIETPGGEQWTTPSTYHAASDWKVTEHSHALDNEEGDQFRIVDNNGLILATSSPWHGYFTTGLKTQAGRHDIHLCWTPSGILLASLVDDSGLRFLRFNFDAVNAFRQVVSAEDIQSAQIGYRPEGAVALAYLQAGDVNLISSTDWGETWSAVAVIASGEEVAIAIDWHSGIEYLAIHDGTTWKCFRSTDEEPFVDVGDIVTAEPNRGGLEVHPGVERKLVFVTDVGSGQIKRFTSLDRGATWEEA